jgi:auxin influx carrier (AUX1 LAX family)
MDKPMKFKYVFVYATLYVFTLTIPSALAVYWAFGDTLLKHSNSLSLLPKTVARDVAVLLMLIHQVLQLFNYKFPFGICDLKFQVRTL